MDPNRNERECSVESGTSAAGASTDYGELAAGMTLSGVMELCARLSAKNRGVVSAFIETLMNKESEAAQRFLVIEKSLAEQKEANLELSARVSRLESQTVAVEPAKPAATYAEQAAKTKERSVPRNKKDLLDLIQVRKEVPAQVIVTIKPPEGTKDDPVRYLARKFDLSKAGMNIQNVTVTKDQKTLVRLRSEKEKDLLTKASALKDCDFNSVYIIKDWPRR